MVRAAVVAVHQTGAVRRWLLFIAALVVLTGCHVDVNVDVDVRPDGSGTITVKAVADADVVKQAPELAKDLNFTDATAVGWTVDGPTATDGGGLSVAISHPFATVEEATALLGSINGPSGPLHNIVLARTSAGDSIRFTVNGSLRVDGGLSAFADPDLLATLGATPYADQIAAANLSPADAVTMAVAIHLPGKVTSAAEVSDRAIRWTVPLVGQPIDVASSSVVSRSNPGGSSLWKYVAYAALGLAIAWAVFALGLIAAVRRARQRRAARRRAGQRPRPRATV